MRDEARFPCIGAEQFLVPIKQGRSLDLLEGKTLMSTLECDIARNSPNQLEIKPDSPALAPEQFPVPHHTGQVG